jgi:hypothetical protein
MKIILSGTALSEYETKQVEIGGKPMLRILGPMRLDTGETMPITIWGDNKGNNWKQFAESGEPFSIVAELQAKPQTFTNHEGETVTVPNLQIKLYSYLNVPSNGSPYYRNTFIRKTLPTPRYASDPTGCFINSTPEEKAEHLRPISEKVKPWRIEDTPGLEAIL